MRTFLAMISTVILAAIALILMGSAADSVQGQVLRPVRQSPIQVSSDKIMRVHTASGQARPQDASKVEIGEPPPKLTPNEKLTLTGLPVMQLSATGPFSLTPARPSLLNRGTLLFENPVAVNTDPNHPAAFFKSQADYTGSGFFNNRDVTVVLDSLTPGKHYMIDCAVKNGETYYVRVLPGEMKQTFSGTNHVVIILEAGDTYAEIGIAAKANGLFWHFYSAEVTRLD